MRTVRSVAVLLALAAVAAGCTGRTARPPAPAPFQGITGRTVPDAGPTLGAKWDWSRVQRFTPYLGRLGGGATFYELVWCDVERERGNADWSTPDRVVTSAGRLGYTMFLKLRIGSCWATQERGGQHRGGPNGKTASAMPADLDAYRTWVGLAVRRYAPLGVHEWAIENEVNAANFWAASPADYQRLTTIAAAAVRAADPAGKVVDCGISSTAYGVAIAADLLLRGRGADAVAAYQRYYARPFQRRGRDFPRGSDEAGL